MTVLHIIAETKKGGLPQAFLREMLAEASSDVRSLVIVFSANKPRIDVPNAKLVCLSPYLWKAVKNRKEIARLITSERVDVMHIHSVASIWSGMASGLASKMRIPVVVSTYKYFLDWNFHYKYFMRKLPRFFFWQRSMLNHAVAIHAVTEQEKLEMGNFSPMPMFADGEKWKGKVIAVTFSRQNSDGVDYARVATHMQMLYRKVIDSRPFWLMSADDRAIETNLLQLGICLAERDFHEIVLSERYANIVGKAKALPQETQRRMQLHCSDQGVFPLLSKALRYTDNDYPLLSVDDVDRFYQPSKTEFLETTRAWIRVSRTKQMFDNYPHKDIEKKICVMLLNLHHLIAEGKVSLRNLADMYVVLRFENYDEYALENMLEEINMRKSASRIFYILQVAFSLGDGFVPLKACYDRKTKRVLRKLFKSDIL